MTYEIYNQFVSFSVTCPDLKTGLITDSDEPSFIGQDLGKLFKKALLLGYTFKKEVSEIKEKVIEIRDKLK